MTDDNPEIESGTIEPDWEQLKATYLAAEGNLLLAATENGLLIPDILLKAKKDVWGERGSRDETKTLQNKEAKDLSQSDVINGHKAETQNARELIHGLLEKLGDSENKSSVKDQVGMVDKLVGSLDKVVKLERVAHDIDLAADDAPNSIIINMGGKRVKIESEDKPDGK